MKPFKSSNALFTFVKAIIVLICTALLVLIMLPRLNINIEKATDAKLIANGLTIYKSLFIFNRLDIYGSSRMPLPQSKPYDYETEYVFSNSTDFFVYLTTNNFLNENWSIFAGPEIPAAPGKYDPEDPHSIEQFKPENNAWNVVADLNVDDSGTPFLFTRNFQEKKLKSNGTKDETPHLSGPPLGDDTMIIIRMGGIGEVMKGGNILWKNINPAKKDNPILRP